MTEKQEEQLPQAPATKQVWQSPTYSKLKLKESESGFTGVGVDFLVYS